MYKTMTTITVVLSNIIQFDVDGEPYIYQGLSGVVTALDELSLTIIKALKKNKPTAVGDLIEKLSPLYTSSEIEEGVNELLQASILYEPGECMHPLLQTTAVPDAKELPITTLVFHLVNSCNLSCTYCYAVEGGYGAPQKMMTQQTAIAAVDFLIKESRHINDISIILFGGEPFLNWKQLKNIVEYGEERAEAAGKTINFSLTTNGTLLNDERIEFIKRHKIGVSVSIDGDQETHDKSRPFQNGEGTYKLVSRNVKNLVAERTGKPVAARVTLTKHYPHVLNTLDHLLNLGFHEAGFAPVTETDVELLLEKKEMNKLLDQFEEIAEHFVQAAKDNKYLGFSNLTNLLVDLHKGQTKAYGCGAGLGFMAVSPSGSLYLCHRFNENEEVNLGSIFEGINRDSQQKLLRDLHIDHKTTCSTCPLKHSCAGGCYYEAKEKQGEITAPNLHYCNWMLRWTSIGLKTYVRIMKSNPSFMERMIGSKC